MNTIEQIHPKEPQNPDTSWAEATVEDTKILYPVHEAAAFSPTQDVGNTASE